jgi:hypothetical protein
VILAIDPGPEMSAYVLLKHPLAKPVEGAKAKNDQMLELLGTFAGAHLVIEQIASYGMPVGAPVFATCVWSGRFWQRWVDMDREASFLPRLAVKMHLCKDSRANDATIRQALIDRYGPGKERAIGVKKAPGPLYGIKADVWAALALAITYAETGTP